MPTCQRRLIGPTPLPSLQKAFDTIAMARVSGSAREAQTLGFLRDEDRIVMNPEHVLAAAKREVLELGDSYAPPERNRNVYAAGRWARAALEVGVKTLQCGRYASEYDGVIGTDVARVLTGGDLSLPQWVPEPITLCVRYSQIPRGSRQKFKCCWTFSTNTWEPIVIHD